MYDDVRAVDDLDLEIQEGEFFSIIGPSGCGKTTSLRMIAGLGVATAGAISSASGTSASSLRTNGRSTPSSSSTRCSLT